MLLAPHLKLARPALGTLRPLRCPGAIVSLPSSRSTKLWGPVQSQKSVSFSEARSLKFSQSSDLLLRGKKFRQFSTGGEGNSKNDESSRKKEEVIVSQTLPSPISWLSVLIMTIIGGGLLWLLWQETEKTKQSRNRGIGAPAIGGSWTMVDQDGNARTEHDYTGKFQLLYFGFTHCPDVCPVELQKMIEILNLLEKKGYAVDLVPIFVSVDPKRDSVAQLRGYLAEFDQRFVGLTGTPEQVSKMAKLFRVYLSAGQVSDTDDDYLVDHSIFLYLMGPDNKFVEYYGVNLNSNEIARKVSDHISVIKPSLARRIRSVVGL